VTLMFLAFDVGNTNISIGVFEDDVLRATWRIGTDVERSPDEYAVAMLSLLATEGITAEAITEAALASVVPDLVPGFEQLCQRYFKVAPLIVGTGTRTGVRVLYENPRDVGPDRVVDVVAALKLYGPPPLIIVDLGTAVVFDAVSASGDYLGGAIAPGIGIASEALFERAHKLQRVELERPRAAIGRNTSAAVQSGLLFGYVGLIEGVVARFKEELGGKARVIATGGWAPIIARETSIVDVVDQDLTLLGLRMVYKASRVEGA
jgi:type III pantothenate kinase